MFFICLPRVAAGALQPTHTNTTDGKQHQQQKNKNQSKSSKWIFNLSSALSSVPISVVVVVVGLLLLYSMSTSTIPFFLFTNRTAYAFFIFLFHSSVAVSRILKTFELAFLRVCVLRTVFIRTPQRRAVSFSFIIRKPVFFCFFFFFLAHSSFGFLFRFDIGFFCSMPLSLYPEIGSHSWFF